MFKRIIAIVQLKIALWRLSKFYYKSCRSTLMIDFDRAIEYRQGFLSVNGERVAIHTSIAPKHTTFTLVEITKAIKAYMRRQKQADKDEIRTRSEKVAEVLSRK